MANSLEPPRGGGIAGSGPWHRHVRTTVAMEPATALHHSAQRVEAPREGVEHEKHVGLRAQKPPLPGTRPGVLLDPEPQVRAATVGYVATGAPSLSVVLVPDMMHDDGTVQYLLQQSLLARQAELDRRKGRVGGGGGGEEEVEGGGGGRGSRRCWTRLSRSFSRCCTSPPSSARAEEEEEEEEESDVSDLLPLILWPRFSSTTAVACFLVLSGDFLLRAVFPSIVVRPEMPCFMAGMDLKDRCSGMYKAGIAGFDAPRALFVSLVGRPRMLGILAGIDQKDSCSGTDNAGVTFDSGTSRCFFSSSGP